MAQKSALKDHTGHPYPNGDIWLYFTIILSALAFPALVIFNVITQGSELVPWLQPTFHPNNTGLEQWWGTKHLPERFRPSLPQCQLQKLGPGDIFRLSASMFIYTVLGTWNTSSVDVVVETFQERKNAEYRGESFDHCFVNSALYEYSLIGETHSVTIGVFCPGSQKYPVSILMQTTMTFAPEITKDFVGQYYGPGIDLNMMNLTDTSDYRKTVLAMFDVISTDALGILNKPLLPVPPLSIKVYFDNISDTDALLPDRSRTSTLTYVNGTRFRAYPSEGFIYINTIYNLVFVAVDAVNLDLGNARAPNMFRNASRLRDVVYNNKAPHGINASDWVGVAYSFYYGRITPPYETWAEMLRNNQPANISLGHPTGLPKESVMVTSYLCQAYQIKPLKSLLSSVFIGSAAMASTAWTGWFLVVALLANGRTEPRAKCQCEDCLKRELEKDEKIRKAASTGLFGKLCATLSRAKHAVNARDSEQSQLLSLPHGPTLGSDSSAKGE